ncbi:uncharacterized protein SOCEGT47_009030 [Sorangium cellulosum]|uniref:DUF2867 domain-containing protein n=1 Tax=Sorangium cellulosum TaxID=56 RepID=A0A4P2PUS8_SORCE|nr:DUF2867 domain-containing protein [Sorangium cellulosum]AUX20434.1 uncharacterized protein SOCEGT47_009030 [Sorangium cellulosum]
MRFSPQEFADLDLEAHQVLRGVPLNDVSVVDLPCGDAARTIEDVRALMPSPGSGSSSALVRALFWLRHALGRLFGWDPVEEGLPAESYVHRLPPELASRSSVQPGTREGPFRVLYVLPGESVSEIRNATVHAFSCMAIRPTAEGQRLYWAVYVKPVSRWTSAYMALIEPFRRFIVYPRILRQLRDAWRTAYAEPGAATEHG